MSAHAPVQHERLEIHSQRESRSGTYYTLNAAAKGDLGATATVTVKHSYKHNTFSCFTCLTANTCKHSQFVEQQVRSTTTRD